MKRCVALAAALLASAGSGVLGIPPVGAQGDSPAVSPPRIDLVAQSAFVGDDPAEIEILLTGAAPGDRVEVRIYAARSTREEVRATARRAPTGVAFSNFGVALPEQPAAEETLVIATSDDEIGERLRRDPGALPTVIELVGSDGTVRASLVTHLLVLADGADLTLGFLADLRSPLARLPDQTVEVDADAMATRAQVTADHEVPLAVAIQPETLDALDGAGAHDALDTIAAALDGREVLRSPWVALDEEGWRRAGETELVTEAYARGSTTIEARLGIEPGGVVTLDPDATPATLGLLRRVGATAAVIAPDQLTPAVLAAAGPRPIQILDDNRVAMPVLPLDTDLAETLRGDDPELAAHLAAAELAVEAAGATTPLAVLVPVEGVDPTVTATLSHIFAARSWLQIQPVARLFEVDPARSSNGELRRGTLVARPAPNLSARAADLRLTGAMVATYAAMVAPAEAPVSPLETQLLAAAAEELDDTTATAYTSAVFEAVLAGTSGMSVAEGGRITLTDRRAELPLTVRNGQPLPITVEVVLSSEKLRFPDGDNMTVLLQPGDNDLTIRVETAASGDARINVEITSPDGRLELARGVIDIRSTAISGLGLLISILALAVLGGWWARTILRVRRGRAAATVAADPAAGSEPPRGEP